VAVTPLVRRAISSDLPALTAIETESFSDSLWPPDTLLMYDCIVAELGGEVAGFLISREVFAGGAAPPEREILNLAVATRYRRAGIASSLLTFELNRDDIFFLEVRESNYGAQTLYHRFGFSEIGRRPDYYKNPTESAIVMRSK
jgi:ribosomal protein S18 acetylase RimI-like enzyme